MVMPDIFPPHARRLPTLTEEGRALHIVFIASPHTEEHVACWGMRP